MIFDNEEFCNKYDELKSSRKMAEFFHTTKTTILNYAKKIGYDNSKYKTFKDEIGNQYGSLTVLERVENDKNNKAQYKCKCICGNYTIVTGANLRNGNTTSCGCKKYIFGGLNKINELGNKYGKLTVIEEVKQRSNYRQILWKCKCDCGNTVIVQGNHLRSGHTQSCGCIKSRGEEKISKYLNSHNINFIGQYGLEDLKSSKNKKLLFDFAILDNNNNLYCLIEYDGEQHFHEIQLWDKKNSLKERQENDKLKDSYCKEHNIPLLRIKYTDYNNIEKILNTNIKII